MRKSRFTQSQQDLKTTQRYVHLSPAAVEGAIRLLDASRTGQPFGNMLATGSAEIAKSSRWNKLSGGGGGSRTVEDPLLSTIRPDSSRSNPPESLKSLDRGTKQVHGIERLPN